MASNTRPLGHQPLKQVTFERVTELHPQQKKLARRRPPPPNETKHDRFRRLATARMIHARYAIRLLGNLSARSLYESTPDEVARMRAALLDDVADMAKKFMANVRRQEFSFSVPK